MQEESRGSALERTPKQKGANEQYFAFALRKQLTNDNCQEKN